MTKLWRKEYTMKHVLRLASLLMIVSMLLAACTTPAATTVPNTQPPAATAVPAATNTVAARPPTETPAPTATTAVVVKEVRWFVGLGTGSEAEKLKPQQDFVDGFNASQKNIVLKLEIVANAQAYDTLATEIAAGNAPDIVGPVGIRGRDSFKGAWLDIAPLMKKANYEVADFDPALLDFYKEGQAQLGLPFAIFPSFVLFNKDLFDEAGLAYPPQKYGDKYDGAEWDYAKVKEVAMQLTVDKSGNTAADAAFDAKNVAQFGFAFQWTDFRGIGTQFGAGSLVAADNKTAQIPDTWKAAWKWVYDGMWTSHFYPNNAWQGSDLLNKGNLFQSGHIAMTHIHTWYLTGSLKDVKFQWDFSICPSYNGKTTCKMHADTFGITAASKEPDAAFEVLTYMLNAKSMATLVSLYGAFPARKSLQAGAIEDLNSQFPGQKLTWQVMVDGQKYNDNPNHEAWMPAFQETSSKYGEYTSKWGDNAGLDMDKEFTALQADLQKIYDAAK